MDKIIRGFNKAGIDTIIESLKILSENNRILEHRNDDFYSITHEAQRLFEDLFCFTGERQNISEKQPLDLWKSLRFPTINRNLHLKLRLYFNDDEQPLLFLFV